MNVKTKKKSNDKNQPHHGMAKHIHTSKVWGAQKMKENIHAYWWRRGKKRGPLSNGNPFGNLHIEGNRGEFKDTMQENYNKFWSIPSPSHEIRHAATTMCVLLMLENSIRAFVVLRLIVLPCAAGRFLWGWCLVYCRISSPIPPSLTCICLNSTI